MKTKIIRTSTISLSLNILLKGQLKFLNAYFEVLAISSAGTLLEELKDREGVDVYAVEMQRGISLYKDIVSLFKLYLKFKKEKPTIVHSITPKAGLLSMLAAKLAGVPIRLHTFTGLIFPTSKGIKKKILILTDRILCWAATNVYPEGEGVKNDLKNFKITSKTLKVIANGNVNGIDTAHFSKNNFTSEELNRLKNELGIQEDDFVFIFVGRLVGDKGINELIEAFKSFRNVSIVKLLLVGPQESDLYPLKTETIKEMESNPQIISVGYQKDVRPYFAISNALVFPSYREGFPNVVMQAGAMELPCIVSDINGCNEIIIEGINGTIVPAKNQEEILNAMNKLVYDKEYYDALKMNARNYITNRYEQKVVWNAILEEYKKLIILKGFE